MVNSKMLKDRAKALGIRQKDIADVLGLQQPTVNQKINNVRPMLLDEAEIMAALLNIGSDEFAAYFFAKDGA